MGGGERRVGSGQHQALRLREDLCAEQGAVAGQGGAGRVDDDDSPDRDPAGEDGGCRAYPAAQATRARARRRPDGPLDHAPVPFGGCPVGRGAVRGRRVVQPRAAAAEVEEDRRRDDRHPLVRIRTHRPAAPRGIHLGDDPVSGGETEGAATGEDDGVDRRHEVPRGQQVRLPGAGCAPAHLDPTDGSRGRHHDGDAGQPSAILPGGVADPDARHVGDGVRRPGLHGPSMADAGPAGAEPASRNRYGLSGAGRQARRRRRRRRRAGGTPRACAAGRTPARA